jgi:cytochrome o ubiquinol oxidase subunit 1
MGFIVTFTIGGLTGVLMAVPGIDFQMHNSLFLVAHFHNMIIGGVVFGFFAGLTYWWPKFTGFYLHEGLGKAAFWCWLIGFLVAFLPLYALGLMGAARRLDGYDASLGWQGLFIVAGVGLLIILLGVFFQIVQVGYSIWKREELRVGSDPWDGRTLEWSTSTPIAEYNFAELTPINYRDDFWEQKHSPSYKKAHTLLEPIRIPKNTSIGIFIGLAAIVLGFAIIWHIWWLALAGFVTVIVIAILATLREDTERIMGVDEIIVIEKSLRGIKS